MNASYEWLREFVPFDLTPGQLRDLLTSRAATVDDIVRLRSDLSEIVIGRVVEAAPHPNSDHLWVTKVDAGGAELVNVVCGAPNVVAGALYPFAPVGSTLPGGLRLEKKKIRGSISEGMLCSARELRLGTDHEGIMALDVDAAPGTPFLDAVSVGDTRLVIDVLPNRPDLLSHEGLAREISAATGIPARTPSIPESAEPARTLAGAVSGAKAVDADNAVQAAPLVTVEDSDGCPRYMAAIIRGVKIAPSPAWLGARVEAVGSRSINNVVDTTNYMLHGFGQPMHAFDLNNLEGSRIVVRRARAGEKITTLDGVTRSLDDQMTVIADATHAQAIAGVIGGEGSEVTSSTSDILLEVAAFEPVRVRATRRKLGVSTDASYRFERGVDATALARHLDYAVQLIIAVAGGSLDGEPADIHGELRSPPGIRLRVERVNRLLGEDVQLSEIQRLLASVGFAVSAIDEFEPVNVAPPSWRSDVRGEVEVIEEIARLHGYDRFSSDIRAFRPGTVPDAPLHLMSNKVRNACVAAGLLEARPLPFTRSSDDLSLRVQNPLAEDEAYLRRKVLDTLARRAEFNLAHMQRNVRLFEIGAVFAKNGNASGSLPNERMHAGVLVMGDRRPPHFTEPHPPSFDEWDAKGIAEDLCEIAFAGAAIACEPSEGAVLWTLIADGGHVGEVVRVELDAPAWAAPAFGIEIDLEALTRRPVADTDAAKPSKRFHPIPSMPASEVDLALIVADTTNAAEVERVIRKSAGDLLEHLALFDEFRGADIPEGSRSLAWRLTFRHPERTLRDREIQGRTARIVQTLEAELGVRQRTA
jgi:phenylalanyl-tRNA synthetase beta chain